jgi:UDP-N-acetylmuramoyl-tripeptide--D-alanyl-D-alanine ligase
MHLNLLAKHGYIRSFLRKKRQEKYLTIAKQKRDSSNAIFIGITGSSGKSTTTALIAHILSASGKVKSQFFDNLYNGLLETITSLNSQEEFVVVETAVSKQGDMPPQAKLLKPDVAVFTIINNEHYTAFRSRELVRDEKAKLLEFMNPNGLIVLNADDNLVMEICNKTKIKPITYGKNHDAKYRIGSVEYASERLNITIFIKDVPHRFTSQFIGKHFWMPLAAAITTTIELGTPIETVKEQVASFHPLFGRCSKFKTENSPTFILDTAKAPYDTINLALEILNEVKNIRKWAIVGQISDYAGNPKSKYKKTYEHASKVADKVIFIGSHSHRSGANNNHYATEQFASFTEFSQLLKYLKQRLTFTDTVLIKSSQGMHLERIALSYQYDVKCLVDFCGYDFHCIRCGKFETPFEYHLKTKNVKKNHQL